MYQRFDSLQCSGEIDRATGVPQELPIEISNACAACEGFTGIRTKGFVSENPSVCLMLQPRMGTLLPHFQNSPNRRQPRPGHYAGDGNVPIWHKYASVHNTKMK